MSSIINLKKKAETAIEKVHLEDVTVRVAIIVDASGSMRSLYENQTIQNIVNRIMGLAMNFDDNGELDVWMFSNDMIYSCVDEKQCETFIQDNQYEIRTKLMNGTCYNPPLDDMFKIYSADTSKKGLLGKLFSGFSKPVKEQEPLKSFLIFVTDGEPTDNFNITKFEERLRAIDAYCLFIGIDQLRQNILTAGDKSNNIESLVISSRDFSGMSDEKMYEKILTPKLGKFLKEEKK